MTTISTGPTSILIVEDEAILALDLSARICYQRY